MPRVQDHTPKRRGLSSVLSTAVVAPLLLTACPARVGAGEDGREAQVDETDPRVIRSERTGDLYLRDTKAMPEDKPDLEAGEAPAPATGKAPGVGVPDESNGLCRLYAPEYPDPECCTSEYGVDVAKIKALCGFEVYLGEHYRNGCGYHFKKSPEAKTEWLWAAHLEPGKNAAQVTEEHDMVIQRRFRKTDFESVPIPGVSGGYWSVFAETGWAVLPGWKRVRQFGYPEGFCDGKLPELMAELARAKEPEVGSERLGLVPRARD